MVIALNTYGTTSLSDWMFCCYFTVEAESIPGWFSVRSVISSSEWVFFVIYRQIRNTRCVQSTHKGVNLRSKDVTQKQQQKPESATVTHTWHANKYKLCIHSSRATSLNLKNSLARSLLSMAVAATSNIFGRDKTFCRNKIMFVATKYFCRDKKFWTRQRLRVCRDKSKLVATKLCLYLSRQKYVCRDKNDTCGSYRQW